MNQKDVDEDSSTTTVHSLTLSPALFEVVNCGWRREL